MLVVDNIRYQYENDWFEFSLCVEKGDIVALIGPSGAGKSTLLSLIAGFITPVSGEILVDKQSLLTLPVYERPFSMLFQEYNLFPHLSVRQNIGLGMDPGLTLTKDQWRTVRRAAGLVGIDALLEKRPEQLSGGQKQRLTIARMLLRNPDILIFDEATSSLDNLTEVAVMEAIHNLAGKKTIILIAHRLSTVSMRCDLYDGTR